MPIYEYECPVCGYSEEQIDSRPSKWHRCHCGAYLKYIISASNFKINGFSEANGYSRKEADVE